VFALAAAVLEKLSPEDLVRQPLVIYRVTSVCMGVISACLLTQQAPRGVLMTSLWPATATFPLSGGAIVARGELERALSVQFPETAKKESGDAGRKTYVDVFNGGKLVMYTDKGRLEERMWFARGGHRMMAARIQRLVCNNGIDFDYDKAWQVLTKRGRAWTQGDSREGMIEARLAEDDSSVFYRYLQDLPCAGTSKTFCALFTVGMGGSGAMGHYDVDLQTFSPVPLTVLNLLQSSVMKRLRVALGTWESFMVFSCGTQMEGVVKDIQQRLFRGDLSSIMWEPAYIKYLLERALAGVYTDVLETSHDDYGRRAFTEGRNISDARGVASVFAAVLDAIKPTHMEQDHFLRTTGAWMTRLVSGRGSGAWGIPSAGVSVSAAKPLGGWKANPATLSSHVVAAGGTSTISASAGGNGNGGVTRTTGGHGVTVQGGPRLPCKHQLMHDLGVLNLQNNVYNGCRKQPCDYEHVDITTAGKKRLYECVSVLSKPGTGGREPVLKKEVADQARERIKAL
jgi:hypothetical protein